MAMLCSLPRVQGASPTVLFLCSTAGKSNRTKLRYELPKICRVRPARPRTTRHDGGRRWLCQGLMHPPFGAIVPPRGPTCRETSSFPHARTRDARILWRNNARLGLSLARRGVLSTSRSSIRISLMETGDAHSRDSLQPNRRQQQHLQTKRYYNGTGDFGGDHHSSYRDQDSLGLFGIELPRRVIKPERVIIVRHGESLGNLDESTYVHVPDWKIPLTKKGFGDGQRAGTRIKEIIGDKPLFIYTSPYLRTKQTLAGMVEAFDTNYIVGVREEPRLTEQQFGNFQNLATIVNSKAERARFGRFYYRFPQGESGLDVYNRATSFIATMFRDFANESIAREDLNVIIVTHGLTLRLLVMRWFQYSIADFEETLNPANGGFVVMERKSKPTMDGRFLKDSARRHDIQQWYELTPESRAHINLKEQRQFGSLWKLLSELPDEPGVVPDEHKDPHWED